MADTKLSALTALATEPADTDQFYINDGGVSKRIAWSTIKAVFALAAQGVTADSALQDVVEDTTPQLGGSLDVNGNKIVSVSNGNIDIEPHGTGNVLLGNFIINADAAIGAGQDNFVLTYDHAAGTWGPEAAGAGSGDFKADGTVDMTGQFKTDVGTFASDVANGAAAVGFLFNTTNSFSTSGAKIASFRNDSTEKAYIDKDGVLFLNRTGYEGSQYIRLGYSGGTANPTLDVVGTGYFQIDVGGTGQIRVAGTAEASRLNLTHNTLYFRRNESGAYPATITCFEGTSERPSGPLTVQAGNAGASNSTQITGAALTLSGGAGASGSAGNAHGGNVTLSGGTGYGTGHKGYIILDLSSLPTSDPSVNGALWLNAGVLTVSGA